MAELVDRLKEWVLRQIGSADPTRTRNPTLLAAHLDGIADSGGDISRRIEEALTSSSTEALDDLITKLEIDIEHLNGHWQSLKADLERADQESD